MKKIVSVVLAVMMAVALCFGIASCTNEILPEQGFEPVALKDVKVGLICLHDTSSTYDKNFIDAMYRALDELGMSRDQLVMYTGIDEKAVCYDTAKKCVNEGCQVVFADSFGHEDFMIQAANEFPNVRFCHATGTKAHTEELNNYSNAFASIYEGRYAAGVAAGMKLNEMIAAGTITADQAVMGYVGAYTYAEVMSGYTSFFLGAKSVCPSVTMKVKFTGKWYDYDLENAAAKALISDGCVLISQHADSYGAPEACEAAGVPNVSYNGSTASVGPNTYIVSSKIDWTPYFVYMIQCVVDGEQIATDWTGSVASGSVKLEPVNATAAAAGTQEAINALLAEFKAGTKNVFVCDNFTVGGQKLTSYLADVDTDKDYTKDTEVIKDGVFYESTERSAPYFDIQIDGISFLGDPAY